MPMLLAGKPPEMTFQKSLNSYSKRDLLRSSFGVKIDKDDFGLDLFEQGIDHTKGIFPAGHENPALEVNDRVGLPLG